MSITGADILSVTIDKVEVPVFLRVSFLLILSLPLAIRSHRIVMVDREGET